MATTTRQTTDVAQTMAGLLESVPGLRVHWYIADTLRPPAAVIGQPEIDFTDQGSGFCRATWDFPVTVIVTRANDRDAQTELSRLLLDIVTALGEDTPGIFSVEPQRARPIPVTVGGQELPGYELIVRIRA